MCGYYICTHEEKKNCDVKESNVIARSFKYSYPLNLAEFYQIRGFCFHFLLQNYEFGDSLML